MEKIINYMNKNNELMDINHDQIAEMIASIDDDYTSSDK
jgi:hypothetical protein